MASWDETKPLDSDIVSQFPANERAARAAVKTNFGFDHHEAEDSNIGFHDLVTMIEGVGDPASAANIIKLYAKDVGGVTEFFWRDSAGNIFQLTTAGAINAFLSGVTTASAGRTSLGVVIGTDVQAWDVNLDQIAALAPTDSNFIVGDGAAWVLENATTARSSLGLGAAATLGLATGLENAGGNITPNFDAFPEMTANPVSSDDFVYLDNGVHKRINWNQFRSPSYNDADARTFGTTDLNVIGYYTGAGGHTWTVPTGLGGDDDYLIVINSGSGDLTLAGSGVTLNTAAPGLVMPANSMAVLVRETSTVYFVGGTGLRA